MLTDQHREEITRIMSDSGINTYDDDYDQVSHD